MRVLRFTPCVLAAIVLVGVVLICGGALRSSVAAEAKPSPREPLPGLVSAPRPLPGVGRWQLARKRPTSRIVTLAWNRDATRIACNEHNNVRIDSVRTLQTEMILVGHTKPVTWVDWNHPTNRLASSSRDGSVRIWSATGTPERVLTGHTDEVNMVAWTKDGTRLASASNDGTVRIWTADGAAGPTIKVSPAAVRSVAWSPDGRLLVSGDAKSLVKIWNADGTAGPICKGHLGEVTGIAWSPDGGQFASATIGYKEPTTETVYADVRIWKADGSAVSTIPGASAISGLCWNPDGQSLAVLDISEDDGIRVYNLKGAVINRLPMPAASLYVPYGLGWSPDGKRIAAGGFGNIEIVNVAEGTTRPGRPSLRARLSPRPAPLAIFSPNADKFLVRMSHDEPYQIWTTDGKPGPELPAQQVAKPLWNSLGDKIAFVDGDKSLRVWRIGVSATRLAAQATSPIELVEWNPRGDALAVLERSGTFRLIGADGSELLELKLAAPVIDPRPMIGKSDSVSKVMFRPDSQAVAVVEPAAINVIPLDVTPLNRTKIKTLAYEYPVSGGQGNGLWWSQDGYRLTSLRKQQKETTQLVTWDLRSGKQSHLNGFDDEVAAFDCSPDGKRCLIGGDTGIWETLPLDNLHSTPTEVPAHTSAIRSASFSHDGRRFATGGWDSLIKLWSADGTFQQSLFGNVWPVHGLTWSTDDKRLVSLERDRTQRLYSLETGRPELTLETADKDDVMLIMADGRIFGRTPKQLDEIFVALLEKPSGEMEIVDYTEFLKRTGQLPR